MELFEHDTWGQGNSAVGDFSPRIPLLIRNPRSKASGRIDAVVRSIDLAPTLLELAGAPIPASMEGVSLAGCQRDTICPQLDAYNETGIWITDIPGLPKEHLRYPDLLELIEVPNQETGTLAIKPEYLDRIIRAKDRMIRSGRWKLVYQPMEEGYRLTLFDVVADSQCRVDVLDQHPDIADSLWRKLSYWIAEGGPIPSEAEFVQRGDAKQPPKH